MAEPQQISEAFYYSVEFWISTVIGLAGLIFSILAFFEARQAKTAAFDAGRTVKIQTVTIELSEIAQRLDRIDPELEFSDARDLLTEISRRLRRLIAPFQTTSEFKETCEQLKKTLDEARIALGNIRPNVVAESDGDQLPESVYFATQGYFFSISSTVAELMGLFEKTSIDKEHV